MTTSKQHDIETPLEPLPGVGSTLPGPFDRETPFESGGGDDRSEAVRTLSQLSEARRIEGHDKAVGYGTDPNLVTPQFRWPKTLTLYDRQFIAALSDVILPATNADPAPSQVGIADFFDDWLSAPYDLQKADKQQILTGLAGLDRISRVMFGDDFLRLTGGQQSSAVDTLLKDNDEGRKFFVRFRYLVIGGYFTSDVGMRAIGYRGNIPLRKPAAVSPEVLAILERELQKLGL